MINVEQTIISQYGNSATITQLIRNMNEYFDPSADFDTFYSFVWDVTTAVGFGLDIWGRIVNVSRELTIPSDPLYFGFNEASPGSYPFNEQPFWDGSSQSTNTYLLADDAYRQLILTKALANITSVNAPSLNQLLQNLFSDRGRVYVNDLGGMSFRYVFEFDLTPVELAIVTQSGVFPRPAGVKAFVFQSAFPLFGFSEAGSSASPFGEGIFVPEGATYAIV